MYTYFESAITQKDSFSSRTDFIFWINDFFVIVLQNYGLINIWGLLVTVLSCRIEKLLKNVIRFSNTQFPIQLYFIFIIKLYSPTPKLY